MRRGFAAAVVGFLRGIISVIVAYLLCGWVGKYITTKTQVGTLLESKIKDTLSNSWEDSAIYKAIPSLFKSGSDGFTTDLINDGAEKITSIIISILSFIIILVVIRLFLGLVLRLFSARHRDGVIGFMDRFLGTLLGVVFGAFFVMAFLALVFPILGLVAPSQCETVLSWFDNSFFAKDLYDNNLLLVLFRDFFL